VVGEGGNMEEVHEYSYNCMGHIDRIEKERLE
jgi:hypothetical protein